ncbi:MAG TPA: sigma 54-interacting transcriptional regulator [Syntrophomonas sp.]|nr:sigma 54-interacting transcriptional regulator [Syntrophomonas sp.]
MSKLPKNSDLLRNDYHLSRASDIKLTDEFVVEMDKQRWQAVEECKERFLRDNENPYENPYMYPEIAASWIRSKKYGVDPYRPFLGYNLKPRELAALMRDQHAMLEIAGEFMQRHLGLLASSGYYMCLVDKNGILLLCAGASNLMKWFERVNARPGAVWTEETIGTNCHSLCMHLKKPVQLIGPYYYSQAVYDNIGSGTPILDENGDVQGALLVVDAKDNPEKQIKQTHILGWVVSAGLAIESQLKLINHSYQLGRENKVTDPNINAAGESCITLDKKGCITHINSEAAFLFSVEESEVKGVHFSMLFTEDIPVAQVLRDGMPVKKFAVTIKRDLTEESHAMDIEPIISRSSDIPRGVLLRLTQSAQIKKVRTVVKESHQDSFAPICGESEALKQVIDKTRRLAHNNGGVLLVGESGTGKELFAHAIHDEYRPEGSFIAINCSSMPKTLIESELFGYEGGSFTGAERRGRMGKIELANGGTLFLDEIGDMPLEVQPVLLRVLEDKKVMRIGGKKYIPVDFRVVAATNRDLLELVKAKQFREDLYYRLAVFKLVIPPLRDRDGDVLRLAEHFIAANCKGDQVPQMTPQVKKILTAYDWPGNVRQLQNTMAYALAMSSDDFIRVENLPDEILADSSKARRPLRGQSDGEDNRGNSMLDINQLTMMEIEKAVIAKTLQSTGYNIHDAANILGLARSTLYRKIKELDID